MPANMKSDWNDRARENAHYYIASSEDEAAFDASGRRDVSLFFAGLEDLLTPRTRALDIGCGIGRMDKHVASHVGKLTGVDVSGEMVAMARHRLSELSNVEFREGDGESLPVPDAS
jgi:SAM-dependent methyltransferase